MHVSFQKIFYVVASLLGMLAVLIVARTVLIPLAFAVLLAFILYPVVRKIESWGVSQTMSAFLSILALSLRTSRCSSTRTLVLSRSWRRAN